MASRDDSNKTLEVGPGTGPDGASMPPLQPVITSGSISITPEMFQAMYLSPENRVKGDLRKTFGNPTPVGLAGFLLAFTPFIISFMGWRGAGGEATATVGTLYFLGGLLGILASIGEWILGNSFPSTYFGVFGGFFLYYGATVTPWFNAAASVGGSTSPEFLASNAYVAVCMGLFTLYASICALRVNVLFVIAFALLTPSFIVYAAGQFAGASGDEVTLRRYVVLAGKIGFPVAIIGWYLLLEIMLSTVDFPFSLPVGDLSQVVPSRSQLRKGKKDRKAEAATSAA